MRQFAAMFFTPATRGLVALDPGDLIACEIVPGPCTCWASLNPTSRQKFAKTYAIILHLEGQAPVQDRMSWFGAGSGRDFFPRASERRVLPIVGVCKTSSHLHISSSHPLIFTSAHLHILSSSHPLIFTSAHLHTFPSSHLLIFTPSHHICSSSHLLIFTSSYLHIFSSSHLLIFTSAHLHICSSSHLFIFTSAHLHICSSSHLLIFTPAHLHICSSSHLLIFTPSHLLIFTSAHLHICSSSHLLMFTSAHLHIFLSSHLLTFSLMPSFYLSLLRPRVVPAASHETSTLSQEMRVDRQKLR